MVTTIIPVEEGKVNDEPTYDSARFERVSTGSWITLKARLSINGQPFKLTTSQWEIVYQKQLPDWELAVVGDDIK